MTPPLPSNRFPYLCQVSSLFFTTHTLYNYNNIFSPIFLTFKNKYCFSTLTIQVRCEFSTNVKQYVSLGKKLYCEIFNPDEFDATKSGTSSATPRTTPRVRTASQSKRNYSIKQNQKNSGKNTSKYFKRRSVHRVYGSTVVIVRVIFIS